MIHIGDKIGLYRALNVSEALTSQEIAEVTGTSERWVREWCANQVAARIVEADHANPQQPRYSLSLEARAVLADPDHPAFGMGMFHRLPATMERLADLPEAFSSGVGFDYDAHGHEGAVGIERSFEPWSNTFLLPVVLPALHGVIEKLRSGAKVADIGCGAGSALLLMAKEFPNSTFVGYDISQYALARANEKASDLGLDNVRFVNPKNEAIANDHSIDFVTTFDCLHDMTRPQQMVQSIFEMLKIDGSWLLVEIKAMNTLAENVQKNPMAALMYGISILSCMASALSEKDGEGLGTLGLSRERAQSFATSAGFTNFDVLDITHSVNAFYEIRP